MKKLLMLLLCLMLLPLPALASEAVQPTVFLLTAVDEAGQEVPLGSGLLMLEGDVLLTSAPVPETLESVRAYAPDGKVYEVLFSIPGDQSLMLLVLYGESTLPFAGVAATEDISGTLVGMTRKGLRYNDPAESVTRATFAGHDAWLVSAREPLMPGAALVDGNGDVFGITVADWGEGEGRYVAVTGNAFATLLMGGGNETSAGDSEWLTDARFSYDAGLLTVDWSECEISGLSEESTFTLYFEDVQNPYFSYITGDSEKTAMNILLAPGRDYRFWVRHSHGEASDAARPEDKAMTYTVPELGTLTDYGFTDESYLGWSRADETPAADAELPKLDPISADSLRDPDVRLYLQVINSYAVTEEIERDMVYVLHTPEDYTFFLGAGYIFGPSYMDRDVWNADVTDLFADYLSYNGTGSFAPGEYTISYVIGGQWAGGFSFMLE